MTRNLFKLFDEAAARDPSSLVASDPQSLSDMSDDEGEQDTIVRAADRLLETDLKVDYSDFANHVFLNSALDYFNITGEKIIGEYPYGGSRGELQAFSDSLDGYQRYVLSRWPKRLGHLVFRPAVSSSYVQVDDVGQEDGVTQTSLLSPGTGSWTVELWYNSARTMTGSDDVTFLVQKATSEGSVRAVSLFLSGSSVFFRVTSGSDSTEVSAPASINSNGYVMAVLDRSSQSGSLYLYTGSLSSFPKAVSSASVTFGGPLTVGSSSLFIGSGTLSGKTTVFYSGTIDDVRVWRVPLDLSYATSSFNRKAYARSSLVALWRFNETGSTDYSGINSVVQDHSGHRINGRIKNYWSGVRGSGSLFYETPDPILDIRCPELLSFVLEQQNSGSEYDRSNSGKITDLVPAGYLEVDNDQDEELVTDFLYTLGRHYDKIKLYAEHLQYSLRVNYTDYDQVPDAKLEDMARFFGWELPGGFIDASALQYFIGRDVQSGELSNDEIDQKLHEIKVQFWRRVLNNLAHLYKTKGTRESVQALLNSYGVNSNFFRLKEYGYTSRTELSAQRIASQMSTYAVQFGSGSLSGSINSSFLSSSLQAVPSSSLNLAASSSYIQMEQMSQSFPSGAGEFFTLTGARPKNIWLMQEPTGTGIYCSITNERLGTEDTYMGIKTGATASGFWYNGSFTGKKCLEFIGGNASHVMSASLSSVLDVTTGSFFAFCIVRMPATGANALQGPFGKYNGTADIGYECLFFDSSRLSVTIRDTPAGFTNPVTSGTLHQDYAWHVIGYGLSKTSGTAVVVTDHEFRSVSAGLVTGSISSTALFRLGSTRTPDVVGTTTMQMAYFAFFTGSDAEQMMAHGGSVLRRDFWKHASSSFGDYRRFGDTICTEIGSDEYGILVGTYGKTLPGQRHRTQVPYSYASGFSGSQSVGLAVLPSYGNYIEYPTNISAWTHVNCNTSPGTSRGRPISHWEISPWRTNTTSVTTGSGVGASVYTNTIGTLIGSSVYCASVYLKASVAHTCTLRIEDSSGNVISTYSPGVTTTWARYHLTGTVPAASSSLRFNIFVSTPAGGSGEYLTIEGAQVNEGPYPLPLLTNARYGGKNGGDYSVYMSSVPALTGTYIAATLGAEQVPPSAGRVDVLYSAYGQSGLSGSILGRIAPTVERRVLAHFHAGTSDANSRQLFIESGSSPVGGIVRDPTNAYETVMTASTTLTGAKTAVLVWNQNESGLRNIYVGNDGLIQATSQSFSTSTVRPSTVFIGHTSASMETSGSSHLYGVVSRITMYSGSYVSTSSYTTTQHGIPVDEFSVEARVMWPTSGNLSMTGSLSSGSLWFVRFRDEDSCNHLLRWVKTSADGKTGSLILTVGSASATASNLPIFNDRWHNVYVSKENSTGSYTIRVSRFNDDAVAYSTSSVFYSSSMVVPSYRVTGSIISVGVGSTGSHVVQQWMDEFKLWSKKLTDQEMEDHCLNYRSFGSDRYEDIKNKLLLHWRLDDGQVTDSSGRTYFTDYTMNDRVGTGSFMPNFQPSKKFLNEYAYIGSPDFGWTENKVRVFDGSELDPETRPIDSRLFSLELNMVDQLNEDISQMLDSFDQMNDAIGHGASQFRSSYDGLDGMRREYFRRLTDRLNFRVFVDMLQFFDRSFVSVIRKLIPARAIFTGDEVVVESHMLERSKVQYSFRPVREVAKIIEGVITMLRR